jgi:hypothetical protein
MDTEQDLKLKSLLERFRHLSGQKFSFKRENAIDDVIAALMRIQFASGQKNYKDEDRDTTRTRCFTYKCDDRKHHLLVRVIIVKGKPGEAKFTIEKKF